MNALSSSLQADSNMRRPTFQPVVAQLLLGLTGLALLTFICFKLGTGPARTGFAYVILIALVSLLGSFSASVVLAIVATACLNFFFAPPLFELRVDAADDIERIVAFLTTSLVVTALTTRRRTAEKELAEGKSRLEEAQRLAHVGWWERDLTTGRVTVSDEVARILGERPVARWLNLIHPEDRQKATDAAEAAMTPGGPRYDVEYRVVRPDGTERIVHSQGEVTRDASGRPVRQFGALQDITELRQAEQGLRASEARFRTFVDHATDAFFLLDENSTVLDANRQACLGLGCRRDELIGKHRSDFDVGLDDTTIERLKERIVAGEAITFETRHRRKDGTSFPVEVRVAQFEQDGRRFLCLVRDISERKKAEDELRASETRFRTFVDHATDGFFLFGRQQVILDVNRQACEGLGYTREELIGKYPRDFDAALDETSIARLAERVNAGEIVTFESLHRRKDGTVFPVEVRVRQFQQGAGRLHLSVARDISERKRAEEEVRKSNTRLEEAQRIAHVGWWERDFSTGHVSLSDEVCRIFGLQPVDLPDWHQRWLQLIHPEDRPRAAEAAAAALVRDGPRYDVEYRVVRPDGTERKVHSQGDVTWDASGRPFRQFGVLQDITELRRAEEELRDSEERFRTLIQFSFDGYWETDAQHRFIRQQYGERLDHAPWDSEIGKTRWEVPCFEPDAEAWRKHREILDAHLPFRDFEIGRATPEGDKFYVSVSGLPVFDKSGNFVGYRGVGRNVTERRGAEEALRRSEAYLAEAQRLSHTGTLAFNASGPVYWSQESYLIWGLDPLQGLPKKEIVLQRIHPADRERVDAETDDAVRQKRGFELEFRIVLPEGTIKYIESTGYPLLSAHGELVEMIATYVDVTERKRAGEERERLRQLESDLAHVNRVSMMGELTASLAHEILHPIATARNNARAAMRFLERNPPNMGEVKEALACIVRDADRGKAIVDRIRDHIKKAPPRIDRFDLNEAIKEVIEMVHAPIEKNRVSVRTHLMQGVAYIRGDRVQLQQVVLNLILNAVEAMSSAEGETRELSISTKQDHTRDIFVAVHDSGPGVDPEHLEQVFAPFYTTKTSGIGMGLSICRSIITAHGGRLWAQPNRPRGTTFEFTLPSGLGES
jgi:PAS domain S-box-containing protein